MKQRDLGDFGKYTDWPGRKTFLQEKMMVNAANGSEEGSIEVLKKYLEPLVLYWIDEFKVKYPEITASKNDLQEAGFKYLGFAISKYNQKLEEGKVAFKFSTYFEWFIRQGFLDSFKKEL